MDELPSWHSKGGGFSGTALGHRPQNRAKGADPRTSTPLRRNVFLPWCPVSSLSWPACAGAFLVPGRWFSGPAPTGSCLYLFRLMFLSTGRGRHVPAPSGRDVGSSAGAPTQEPALSRYSFTCAVLVFVLSHLVCVVYFLLFPRCKSVHRVCPAISIFSGARVLPGDWDPIAPGRRPSMTTKLLRQRPLSLFMQHVPSTSAFCTA